MPSRGQQPVGLRLALAFVAVAVLAVALVAVLAVLFTGKDIAGLVQQRRNDLIGSLAADAISTYNTGKPGWFNVYLSPALELAAVIVRLQRRIAEAARRPPEGAYEGTNRQLD